MIRTYVDSGVFIAIDRANDQALLDDALTLLSDDERRFVVSQFVALEVLPSATAAGRQQFLEFWTEFLNNSEFVMDVAVSVRLAFDVRLAEPTISAMDALHIAAAKLAECDEFVTTERVKRAIHKTQFVRVIQLSESVSR